MLDTGGMLNFLNLSIRRVCDHLSKVTAAIFRAKGSKFSFVLTTQPKLL